MRVLLNVLSVATALAIMPAHAGDPSATTDILTALLSPAGFADGRSANISPRRDSGPSAGVQVAGAECPNGSGKYCGDELPYCCPGVSVDPYCAADVNGCTK